MSGCRKNVQIADRFFDNRYKMLAWKEPVNLLKELA